jgi:4-hydroxy-tetrahydrodipicolinate synthase
MQAELFAAVQANNTEQAQALHQRITATADVFYAAPWVDMHNRMKEALVMQGRLPRAVVRPPLVKIEEAERQRIRQAMQQAGLLPQRLAA